MASSNPHKIENAFFLFIRVFSLHSRLVNQFSSHYVCVLHYFFGCRQCTQDRISSLISQTRTTLFLLVTRAKIDLNTFSIFRFGLSFYFYLRNYRLFSSSSSTSLLHYDKHSCMSFHVHGAVSDGVSFEKKQTKRK